MNTPRQEYNNGIFDAKQRVKASILKHANVEEHPTAFVATRDGWQIGFAFESREDALKVISVAVENDFEVGGPNKCYGVEQWEIYVNLDKRFFYLK